MTAGFTITALNDASESENRMHSDEVAARYGFSGALVSGVNVFGYMTQPLVATQGPDWFQQRGFNVRFLLPAYEHDEISIESRPSDEATEKLTTHASNQHGTLLAVLESWSGAELDSCSAEALQTRADSEAGNYVEQDRPLINWENIELNKPAPIWHWIPSSEKNQKHVQAQRDSATCYQAGSGSEIVHPYYLLDTCNKALMRMFVLPAWIHVGSQCLMRRALKVGEALRIDCVATEKWERKGHQFIRLKIVIANTTELLFEAEHTAIFRIAEKT
jgi:hypothetical protein